VPDHPGVAARHGTGARIDVDCPSIHEGNTNDIAFTVTQTGILCAQ